MFLDSNGELADGCRLPKDGSSLCGLAFTVDISSHLNKLWLQDREILFPMKFSLIASCKAKLTSGLSQENTDHFLHFQESQPGGDVVSNFGKYTAASSFLWSSFENYFTDFVADQKYVKLFSNLFSILEEERLKIIHLRHSLKYWNWNTIQEVCPSPANEDLISVWKFVLVSNLPHLLCDLALWYVARFGSTYVCEQHLQQWTSEKQVSFKADR